MDQLSAHLDRGWDLAQKGDATGASECGKRALELDPQSPEVHNLLGYAADGFGIYGVRGVNGETLTNADLDECHGHTHAITWNGATVTLYHYHATYEFPYTLGCFRGTPVND